MSSYKVTKNSEYYVTPASPTPTGELLSLAWIDRYPTHRGLVDSLHIFTQAQNPAKTISEAVGKALVHYYPLAGRIVQPSPEDEPKLLCTGQGVWFVEASANCTLEEINFLERPMVFNQEDLCAYTKIETDPANTIMMIQITEFKCGGFVMGLRFNHASADGMGSAQFISAVSELARGLPEPTVKPVWEREAYPNPRIKPAPLPELPKMALEYAELDFPLDYINKLKSQFIDHAGTHCSTFDLIIAKTWQNRVKAVNADPDVKIRMVFFASTRHILKVSKGFYGNSIFPVKVDATSGEIAGKSVVEIVDVIREAKKRMTAEVLAWANDELTHDPFSMTFNYETIYVSDWTKLGFSDADYGWGKPMYCGPFTNNDFIASCILLKSPAPLQGARLVARCVSKEHFEAFTEQLKNFD